MAKKKDATETLASVLTIRSGEFDCEAALDTDDRALKAVLKLRSEQLTVYDDEIDDLKAVVAAIPRGY